MKVITLWQPWASLVAMNLKRIETRSWRASDSLIGQRIGIHAAKNMPGFVKKLCRGFAKLLPIKEYEGSWLYNLEHGIGPFGKIVATAKLVSCLPIVSGPDNNKMGYIRLGDCREVVSGNEFEFGDYTPGRWAWILDEIKPLKEPIPARGGQRLWNWDHGEIAP